MSLVVKINNMKTTRNEENGERIKEFSLTYNDWPEEGTKVASILEWANGEGAKVTLGDDSIDLTHQEMNVLEILFGQLRLIK